MNKVVQVFQKRGQFNQTGDDVAKWILKAMEDEKPHLHYITNKDYEETIKRKYVDVTGDSVVEMLTQRFFPSEAK